MTADADLPGPAGVRDAHQRAAAILLQHWCQGTQIGELPSDCRPASRAEGYAIQADLARLSGQRVAGWKIAATSTAGQRHIGVDGPLAGRLFLERQLHEGAVVPLTGNVMRVAEAEFAFRMAKALPGRHTPYSISEVLDAVDSLHPAIEIPDSRYSDFANAGGPQLVADTACACWFMVGEAAPSFWRSRDLAEHRVAASRNGRPAGEGAGANVLGDPRSALSWIAHELIAYGESLRPGDVIITGTCITPISVSIGDRVRMDFGDLGAIEAAF